jgi:hypothetical protein
MLTYLISCDLITPELEYRQLHAALRDVGAVRVLHTAWTLETDMSAEQLRDWVTHYVGPSDRILISALTDSASRNTLINIHEL